MAHGPHPPPRRALVAALACALVGACQVDFALGTDPLKPQPPSPPVPVPAGDALRFVRAVSEPAWFRHPVRAEELVAGASHACVRSERAAWCWGSNEYGELGRDDEGFSPSPSPVASGHAVLGLVAGPSQTGALLDDGLIGHWGLYAPRGDDRVTPWSQHDTPGIGAIAGVAFGDRNGLAWDVRGNLVWWGAPDAISFVQSFVIKPVRVYLGTTVTVAQAAVWSRDGDGHGCLLVRGAGEAEVACWGRDARGGRDWGNFRVPNVHGVERIGLGARFACARRSDRSAWCWGANDVGHLGDGTTTLRETPAPVGLAGEVYDLALGARHACALVRDGSVWCWGANERGQLGTSAVETQALSPVRVDALPKVVAVAAGDAFTCARTEDGRVFCWGANEHGQLGDGTTAWRVDPQPVHL